MIVIGLTGGPGTGKSVAAEHLKRSGAIILSGDEAGKKVVEEISGALGKLVEAFGREILLSNGMLDRVKLGKMVFADNEKLALLNSIVHPPLLRLLRKDLRLAKDKGKRLAVIDAALIFEWGIANWCDYILVITARRDIRIGRMISKGLTRKEAAQRIASQIPDREKAVLADFVIENNGNKAQLKSQLDKFLKLLRKAENI